MYNEIHRNHFLGMTPSQIASSVGMDTRTVKKLLAMNEKEYWDYREQLLARTKKLAPYEEYIRSRLEMCREASSAQVHDWLKEHYPDFPKVSIKSVYNFVLYVRNKHQLLKTFEAREFTQVEELPYGKQAQVDFGEYNMTDRNGNRKKVYFFALVLSRSRYKFVLFSERPFTTHTAIAAHQAAFVFLDGVPGELVYDQDKLLLVNENKGNLMLSHAFKAYCQIMPFRLHFCRKNDPQSKGKIENVIKYIKYNFLRGRCFYSIDTLNAQVIEWLERTANAKEHSTTHKRPVQEWEYERAFLFPVNNIPVFATEYPTYNVTKDNVIHFKGSSYSVPEGTFRKPKTEVLVHLDNDCLTICNKDGEQIARHTVSLLKGQQVRNNNHKRDHSQKIKELIVQTSQLFTDQSMALTFLECIHQKMPRYTRDQLGLIASAGKKYSPQDMDHALEFCTKNNLYQATDFESVLVSLMNSTAPPQALKNEVLNLPRYQIRPQTSDISDYTQILS